MKKINTFIKNGLILTISTLFLRLIAVLFNIFLSNKISSSLLGTFGIILSVFAFFLTIALSGINLSSTRLVSEDYSFNKSKNVHNIIKSCFKYCIFFSLLSIFIMIIFSPYITNNILNNTISINLLYILAIALPFCSLSSCLNGYFMAYEKIKTVIISQVIEILMQISIILLFYYNNFFTNNYQICFALVISTVIADICSFVYLIYYYNIDYKKSFTNTNYQSNFIKEICKISLPVALTTYIKSGLSTLKNTLIPLALVQYGLSHNEALSYYGLISSTVMSLILFPLTFIQSYSNLLIPKLSKYNINTDLNKIIKITKKCLILTFIFSIITTIVLIVFSHWIDDNLYKTLSVEFYIKILSPIIVYIYMDSVIDSLLKSLNLQVYVMIINIFDLLISILFIRFLIPQFGINSYIFILYFSEIFNFLLSLFILCKKFSFLKSSVVTHKKYCVFKNHTYKKIEPMT